MTIGLSIWVLVDSPSFAHFLDVIHVDDVPVYRTGAALLLAVACVVFLLTLFGCVGASRESKCMLGTVRIPSLGIISNTWGMSAIVNVIKLNICTYVFLD